MLNALNYFVRSRWYWLAMIFGGLIMEAVALYYQYGLNYGPCVLCIHIRIWVLAFILLGIVGFLCHNNRYLSIFISLLTVIVAIGFTERTWMTFAIERNLIEGSCSMGSGLPAWFALDKWFPAVFEPWELCGWTPDLLFGITMAEVLMVVAPLAIIITLFASYSLYKRTN